MWQVMKNNYLVDIKRYLFKDLPGSKSTYIYFLKCEVSRKTMRMNKIKIGIAKNPLSRLQILQTGNPFNLSLWYCFKVPIDSAKRLEKSLHQKFRWSNRRGEWFEIRPCIINWINEHKRTTSFKSETHILRKKTPTPKGATA